MVETDLEWDVAQWTFEGCSRPISVERMWRDEKMFDVRGLMFDVEDGVAA